MYRSATRVTHAKTNSIPYPFPPVKRKSKNTKDFSFLLTGANFFDYNEGGFFAYVDSALIHAATKSRVFF